MGMDMDMFTLFSDEKYSCLDYHDVDGLDDAEKREIMEVMNDAIYHFLKAAGYIHINQEKDTLLRARLWEWAEAELTSATGHDINSLEPILEQGVTVSEYYYPFASHELRLCMAQGTTLALSADDFFLPPAAREELPYLQCRIWQGLPPGHEWCGMFVDMIKDFTELYGAQDPLIGTLGATGWANYIDGWCLESRLSYFSPRSNGKENIASDPCLVEGFPSYIRGITGAPWPYAVAIFKPTRGIEVPYRLWLPYVPVVIATINFINDILSFPKEVLKGDLSNYVSLTTRTRRAMRCPSRFRGDGSLWTVRDTLCDTYEKCLNNIHSLDRAFIVGSADLAGNGGTTPTREFLDTMLAATLWASFKQGYTAWHLNCGRYYLQSVRHRLEAVSGKPQHTTNGNGV
ncbi:uncharacterized protein GIQ15_06343 [Arthroderma uncinatum]|uniref:uncharacterized protein n=1 Tax=Arthroderma uncinatum TaxID=74035 RepID=UPI00144A7D91|nr:uncharacterized protein GIQ15_06343 [Arthroderma uncinatum]KAF3480996.1 hypothetical protein GIQ15_06343 [Arthroderma uncinatum]